MVQNICRFMYQYIIIIMPSADSYRNKLSFYKVEALQNLLYSDIYYLFRLLLLKDIGVFCLHFLQSLRREECHLILKPDVS
jgi:hypothetical protein